MRPPATIALPPSAQAPAAIADDYLAGQLARTRAQIERVSGMLEEATNDQAIERLCRALGTLRESERILDDRPLPGSRRPGKERSGPAAIIRPV